MANFFRPKQGEIYLAKLSPRTGSEQLGTRPVLVISGNTLNQNMPICIICPFSRKVNNYSLGTVIETSKENGLKHDSDVVRLSS